MSEEPVCVIENNKRFVGTQDEWEEYDRNQVKICVAGDSSCGKTSILSRLKDGVFMSHSRSTISVDLVIVRLRMRSGKRVKVMLYDMVGDDRFRLHSPLNVISGVEGVMLVFDPKRPETFTSLALWRKRLDLDIGDEYKKVVMCNKSDLLSDSARSSELSQQWIEHSKDSYHCKLFFASAKDGENLTEGLGYLLQRILRKRAKEDIVDHRQNLRRIGIDSGQRVEQKSKCCK